MSQTQTHTMVCRAKTTLLLDASVADKTGGAFMGTAADNAALGFTGYGCASGFGRQYIGIDFLSISGIERKAGVKIRCRCENGDVKLNVMVNNIMIYPDGVSYGETDKHRHTLPASKGWQEVTLPDITLKSGDNHIRFYNADKDFMLDYISISEI